MSGVGTAQNVSGRDHDRLCRSEGNVVVEIAVERVRLARGLCCGTAAGAAATAEIGPTGIAAAIIVTPG
jgi:hypothetical protein